jgi:hypothetical protein
VEFVTTYYAAMRTLQQGASEPQSTTPEGRGGGVLLIEVIRIAFVVKPPKPSEPTTESWPHRSSKAWRARGRGVVAVVEQLVTDEGGGWRGARLMQAKFLCTAYIRRISRRDLG